MPHWGGWDGWGWGWGLLMMIGMALLWVVIIAGVVLLVRWVWDRSSAPTGAGRESALDIIQQRYAHGEITAEQYREMKRELGSGGAAPA